MTTTKKQPDGYCAWHPEEGWYQESVGGGGDMSFCYYQVVDNIYVGTLPKDHGWQIKPVCLISPERLEELEGYEAAWNKQVQDRCDAAVVEIDDSVKDL